MIWRLEADASQNAAVISDPLIGISSANSSGSGGLMLQDESS